MTKNTIRKEDALSYHSNPIPGKIEVIPTKQTQSQRDLALAYSPGVAEPCKEIAKNPETVYSYTSKGNLVAVISNGTAVLGLGDIGPEASKPVMEGKGILFKIFAGIDVFDIEVDENNPSEFIKVVKAIAPTFGGINLEDIKAPDCFEIETQLKEKLNIPVMHDDQHGTAIITGAGLINALQIVDKTIEKVKVVVSGAGASALSCINTFIALGARKENIIVCDSKGVINTTRNDLTKEKKVIANTTNAKTLREALIGADVFLGLSRGNVLVPEDLLAMNTNPIVFALANPDPEIAYDVAIETRDDLIIGTGRSDHPNQINNVLGFPFIFRGALDVRATEINDTMKLAAIHAIADLARKPVPDVVNKAYDEHKIVFGKNYIIPKPLDPRLLTTVAPAVAKAAMDSGVAKKPIADWERYEAELVSRLRGDENIIRYTISKAKQNPKRIVFAEAEDPRILKAAQIALDEKIAEPILLGNEKNILKICKEHQLDLSGVTIIDPSSSSNHEKRQTFARVFFEKRNRRGYTWYEASEVMKRRNYFGVMMVEVGEADALISGISRNYAEVIRPALQIVGTEEGVKKVSSMYMMLTKRGPLFFADTTMIQEPTAEELVEIALLTSKSVKRHFNIDPCVAMLSYSAFGSSNGEEPKKVRKAVDILRKKHSEITVDGEIQANLVFNIDALRENYPFTDLIDKRANILIFPNLSSANIAYKLMQEMANIEAVGPIMLGLDKPVHILQLGSSVREIVNMIAIATIDAQNKQKKL